MVTPHFTERKKFLLIAPTDYTLYSLIKRNLEHIGFDVTLVLNNNGKFRYSGFSQRFQNHVLKTFFSDHHFKQRLLMRFNREKQLSDIRSLPHYHYGMVFRSDFFEVGVLEEARKRVDRFVSFHYDGLANSKGIFERIPLFDAFYVFDKHDQTAYPQYGLKHETNFYFDYPEYASPTGEKKQGLYYLFSFDKSRNEHLIRFHRYVKPLFGDVKFEMVVSKVDKNRIPTYMKENMAIYRHHMPFAEHLERIKSYRTVLDFRISSHSGYSFRVFEALKYRKKLITNNPEIRHADFYRPENIYVLDQGMDGITDFLATDYTPLPDHVVSKYSFSNWLGRLLGGQVCVL